MARVARSQHRANRHDLIEIMTDGTVRVAGGRDMPFADLVERCRDMRVIFDSLKDMWYEPSSYTRPDRATGGAKIGPIVNDPGYLGKNGKKRYTRVGRTKRKMKISSSRPYHPEPTEAAIQTVIDAIVAHITGDTTNG